MAATQVKTPTTYQQRKKRYIISLSILGVVALVGAAGAKAADRKTELVTTATAKSAAVSAAQYKAERNYAAKVFHDGTTQQNCLAALWDQESGWNPDAVNSSSGAAGIPQALGHGNVFPVGNTEADWKAQIDWGHTYIDTRYGTPCAAEQHEQADGWY